MPSRYLPERNRATEQWRARIERRLRLIERRSKRGKHRMAEGGDVTVNTGTTTTVATLELGVGAWLINGLVNVYYTTTNAAEVATASLRAYDVVTNEDFGLLSPVQSWAWKGTASATIVRQPFHVVGHLTAATRVRVELQVQTSTTGAAHSVTLANLWLHAAPL